jgi:hypothetical protein
MDTNPQPCNTGFDVVGIGCPEFISYAETMLKFWE